jgi:hypothetical protein
LLQHPAAFRALGRFPVTRAGITLHYLDATHFHCKHFVITISTMNERLNIPDDERADKSALRRALLARTISLSFLGGLFVVMGIHKSRSGFGIFYFVTAAMLLGIAARLAYSLFIGSRVNPQIPPG